MQKAYLIPPSSNFLKTLTNFFLYSKNLKNPETSKIWIVFPTKRASLFFKHYLKIKTNNHAGFLPRVLSFEEFVNNLYILLTEKPFPQAPEILKLFVFLEALESRGIPWQKDFSKFFNWGLKFLEVFEEFEKELRLPENLLYPPETLPKEAKKLFEELKENYQIFSSLVEKKGISYFSYRLKKTAEALKKKGVKFLEREIKELWIAGFVALRKAELEIFKSFKNSSLKTLFFFEADEPPPEIILKTVNSLELSVETLLEKFFEKEPSKPEVSFCEVSDLHLEVEKAVEFLPEEVKSPDEIAIVIPDARTLFPLLFSLEEKDTLLEINVTLQYPFSRILLNNLFLLLIKTQREKEKALYSAQDYLKIVKHPFLQLLRFETGISWGFIAKEMENILRQKGYLRISLKEILNFLPEAYQDVVAHFHTVFFENWETIRIPFDVARCIEEVLNFISPVLEKLKESENWQSILLRNYLYALETKILPLFEEETYIEEKKFDAEMLLEVLEYLLKQETIPFAGDPLKGLQIMGFLETRLLSFKKLIILDVNEGVLPPSPEINPLLTDEIKNYLGIPVYKNELWDYYFERLIKSAEEVCLCYIFLEKSKSGEFAGEFKEPSRFVQKLKWELEKEKKEIREERKSFEVTILQKQEGIPKSEDVKKQLKKILKNQLISRSFIETYLGCGVKFFFKYVLKLKEAEKIGLGTADVGNFLHDFFENFLKPFEGKRLLFKEVYKEKEVLNKLQNFWEKYEFERKIDALSHFFSKKIAFESIKRYFKYLILLEERGSVKNTEIMGIEKELKNSFLFKSEDGSSFKLILTGKADYIIKRDEGLEKYLILDFKSNPFTNPASQIAMSTVNKYKLPDEYDQKGIYEVSQLFGKNLTNFQLIFYYYLFYFQKERFIKNKKEYIINAGFITPSDFKKPEKFLFNVRKRGDRTKIYNFFEKEFPKILTWILNHLLLSKEFYFAQSEDTCKYCPYQAPCKNYKYLLK